MCLVREAEQITAQQPQWPVDEHRKHSINTDSMVLRLNGQIRSDSTSRRGLELSSWTECRKWLGWVSGRDGKSLTSTVFQSERMTKL